MPRLLLRALAALAACVAAGCGVGAGEEVEGTGLLVTRDFGARTLLQEETPETAGTDTVLRLLERNADRVEKRFGGQFVQAIDGVEGGIRDGRQVDWFFYVNGRLAEKGAAATRVHDGDRIWWDHHEWEDSQPVAVVGSFPAPFTTGFDGKRLPVRVECVEQEVAPCRRVRDVLVERGVVASRGGLATSLARETLRVIVGPWERVRGDAALATIEDGPRESGVHARPSSDGRRLALLDARGAVRRTLGPGAGLVAATGEGGEAPVWVVTGTDDAGVTAAAEGLATGRIAGRYAVAFAGGEAIALPAG